MSSLNGKKEQDTAPDGGFGWFIIIITAIAHTVNIGFEKTKTLFYQQLLVNYGQSASTTAWCISIGTYCKFVFSPFIGGLSSKFGHRRVAAVGAVVNSLGYILTGMAPSIYFAYFAFSLRGLGCGTFIVPRVSIQNLYFSKNRGKANSLSSTIGGLGALYMAPLSSFLYSEFGFSGTLLLIGGMALHILPAAMLFRPLNTESREKRPPECVEVDTDNTECLSLNDNTQESSIFKTQGKFPETIQQRELNSSVVAQRNGSKEMTATFQEEVGDESIKKKHITSTIDKTPTDKHKERSEYLKQIATWTGLTVLKDKRMVLLVFYLMSTMFNANTSNTVISGLCLQQGFVLSQVTLMLTIRAAVEFVFKPFFGVIFDTTFVRTRRPLAMGIMGIITGFLAVGLPLANSIPLTMTLWIIHHLLSTCAISQWSTAMSDIVPRSMITNGVGITRFFNGFGALLGPVVAGYLTDYTGSYTYGFYISGSQLFLISIIFIIATLKMSSMERKLQDSIPA